MRSLSNVEMPYRAIVTNSRSGDEGFIIWFYQSIKSVRQFISGPKTQKPKLFQAAYIVKPKTKNPALDLKNLNNKTLSPPLSELTQRLEEYRAGIIQPIFMDPDFLIEATWPSPRTFSGYKQELSLSELTERLTRQHGRR